MSDIVFGCPHCGQAVQCAPEHAGQTLACPHCQGGIIAPPAQIPVEETPSPAPEVVQPEAPVVEEPAVAPEVPPAEDDGEPVVKFNCPGCGEELEIPETWFGDPVGCPDCGTEVTDMFPGPGPAEAPEPEPEPAPAPVAPKKRVTVPSSSSTPSTPAGKKKIVFKKRS